MVQASDDGTGIKHKEEVFMAKRSNQNNEDLSEQDSVNALELLKEDHRKVEQLFQSFEEADGRSRQGIADEALKALEVHTKIEETLVYPAIREATGEEDLVDEANEEHHVVTLLIKELKKMKASAEGYKAKFTVMSELVKHHIEEEEKEMFPEAENADIDWEELGQEAMSIKERMMSKSSRGHRRAA
jgi:hemerythrin superfamily protein